MRISKRLENEMLWFPNDRDVLTYTAQNMVSERYETESLSWEVWIGMTREQRELVLTIGVHPRAEC